MTSKHTFHIVLVRENRGIGIGSESGQNRMAVYEGHLMTIVLGNAS